MCDELLTSTYGDASRFVMWCNLGKMKESVWSCGVFGLKVDGRVEKVEGEWGFG